MDVLDPRGSQGRAVDSWNREGGHRPTTRGSFPSTANQEDVLAGMAKALGAIIITPQEMGLSMMFEDHVTNKVPWATVPRSRCHRRKVPGLP